MSLPVITLHQPWASLMAIEAKRNETRPKPWSHVGDVAIHAAQLHWKNNVPNYAIPALRWLWKYRDQFPGFHGNVKDLYDSLPFSAVVCIVHKDGCISTNDDNGDDRSLTLQEVDLGDYSLKRFYYPTSNCRRLKQPVKCSGKQGIFFLPPEIEAEVLRQL